MVPTLAGRLQTRIFLMGTVGLAVTFLVAFWLPVDDAISETRRQTLLVLMWVALLGMAWELAYHILMQWRWEKDWPTLFGLLTAVPEGILIWLLRANDLLPGVTQSTEVRAFVIHFAAVWIFVWLVANGPMRIPFTHWRFHGGRLV